MTGDPCRLCGVRVEAGEQQHMHTVWHQSVAGTVNLEPLFPTCTGKVWHNGEPFTCTRPPGHEGAHSARDSISPAGLIQWYGPET